MKRGGLSLVLSLAAAACTAPDPNQVLAIDAIDTFWAVDSPVGGEQYIAPVARLLLKNKSGVDQAHVRAMATFHRKGSESEPWGTAFEFVTNPGKPLPAGGSVEVELRSEARYHSSGTPESMFEHPQFQDATIEIFLRVGSSQWVKFADVPIERRIGSKRLQQTASPSPGAGA